MALGVGSAERSTAADRSPTLAAPVDAPSAATADPYADERDAWTVLAGAAGLGPVGFSALIAAFGSARAVLSVCGDPGALERLSAVEAPVEDARRRPVPPDVARAILDAAAVGDVILRRIRALGVRVVTMEESAFPDRLAAIEMPPHLLYVMGDPTAMARARAVAVVGTRHPTSGGRMIAGRIAAALVAARASVVSGLAYGIDGAAHEATLRAGGTTVAVIGGGHAVAGPRAHARLAAAIVAGGGAVVSEHGPDVAPSKGTFPRRNRIISGLSDAAVVVEAPARSGALITASWALEQGRPCFLVPGPIDAPASAGCLAFLREFADATRIVAGVPQLIADLGFSEPTAEGSDPVGVATRMELRPVEAAIAAVLARGVATVDELVAATDLPIATVLAGLNLLERRGLAIGMYGRYRPAGTLLGDGPRIVGGRRVPRASVARSRDPVLP
jgi:DNA processing protein